MCPQPFKGICRGDPRGRPPSTSTNIRVIRSFVGAGRVPARHVGIHVDLFRATARAAPTGFVFVRYAKSPRSGRKVIAHGVSRGKRHHAPNEPTQWATQHSAAKS